MPITIRAIALELARHLERRGLIFFRLNPRVDRGAPHFVIAVPGAPPLALLLQRGDDRASSTDRQLERIDDLERAGWRVAVVSGVAEAIEAVEAARG